MLYSKIRKEKNKMIWNVQLKLERPDEFKKDDKSWFDKKHIKSEIITWLEDLDYNIKKIEIKKI
jgi:hypothetical protein